MEQFLRDRLEIRKAKLKECVTSAEELLSIYKREKEVLKQDVVKMHLSLNQALNSLQTDCEKYIATNSQDTDILHSALEQQMKAEEFLVELDLLKSVEHNAPTQHSQTTAKLPKLELQKFDGDSLKWTEFWDRFNANIHSQNLKESEKFAYLISLVDKEAKEAIQGLPITNANYQVAVDTLQTRYGNQQKVIDSHYEALNLLSCCEYTAESCRKNLNVIETHLRVLASLGENVENNFLRSLIVSKFPERVVYELNLLATDNTISGIRRTLDSIVVAIERSKCKASTSREPIATTEAFMSLNSRPKYSKGKRIPHGPKKRKGSSISDSNMNKKPRKGCIFCSEPHYNDECTKVNSLDERKRKLINRCFICLKMGHQAHECKQRKKCYHCKGNHNRALCPKKGTGEAGFPNVSPILNTMGQCDKTKSFLQTATAQVAHRNRSITCRFFLDSGSTRSYITTGLAKQLDLTCENVDSLLIFTFGAVKPTETLSPCSDIVIRTKRGIEKSIHVNIVPHITHRIPILNIPKMEIIDILADSSSKENQAIDVLIGSDYYFSFFKNKTVQIDSNLFLVDTDFGWVVSGHTNKEPLEEDKVLSVTTYHRSNRECDCFTEPDLPLKQFDLKFLWSLESIRNNIIWKFIPQLAPWHGAFYERLVGLVKHCMKRTLEKRLLNDTQILTVIKEIEAVTNSRPLTRVGPNIDIVLRPCDFLSLGHCLNLEMSENYKPEQADSLVKQSLLNSWRRGQNMLNQFKNMFINQYLMSLRERYHHSHKQPRVKSHKEPCIGDLVQIKDESKNRINWKVGKIVQLIRSPDGYCRVAHVQVGENLFKRSIGHLYPLELDDSTSPGLEATETEKSGIRDVLESVQTDPDPIQIDEIPEVNRPSEILEERQEESSETIPIKRVEERASNDVEVYDTVTAPQPPVQEVYETPHPEEDVSHETDVVVQHESQPREEVTRRAAAIRAREKIAEWTRQLSAIL